MPPNLAIVPSPGPDDTKDRLSRFKALSNEDLIAGIFKCIGHAGQVLLEIKDRVNVLKERGVDVSDLMRKLPAHLRAVANDRLLPDVVLRYGSKGYFERIARLDCDEQQQLLDSGAVSMVEPTMDGQGFDSRQVLLADLTLGQARQVFANDKPGGHIRGFDEQIAFIRTHRAKLLAAQPRGVETTYDRKKQCLVLELDGREIKRLTMRDLARAMEELAKS